MKKSVTQTNPQECRFPEDFSCYSPITFTPWQCWIPFIPLSLLCVLPFELSWAVPLSWLITASSPGYLLTLLSHLDFCYLIQKPFQPLVSGGSITSNDFPGVLYHSCIVVPRSTISLFSSLDSILTEGILVDQCIAECWAHSHFKWENKTNFWYPLRTTYTSKGCRIRGRWWRIFSIFCLLIDLLPSDLHNSKYPSNFIKTKRKKTVFHVTDVKLTFLFYLVQLVFWVFFPLISGGIFPLVDRIVFLSFTVSLF